MAGLKAGFLLSVCVGIAGPRIAFAQAATTANDPPAQLEEIVITAQKKSEDLQHASLTVQVLSSDQIDRQGIKDPLDLQTLLPSVRIQRSEISVPVIRGVGTFNTSAGVDAAIAYSIDGIYLSHYPALPPVLLDIERVEAVLGPQGTLYGRNSNGGAINFITNNPTHQFEGSASLQYGNYATVGSSGVINVPINDQLAIRVAVGSNKHSPYTSDGYNDTDDKGARIKVAYTPSDALRFLFSMEGADHDSHGTSFSWCPPNTVAADCKGSVWQPFAGEGTFNTRPWNANKTRQFGVSNEIDYTMSWASLTSLTGYRAYHLRNNVNSPSNTFAYDQSEDDNFVTQEFRLGSASDSKGSWVTGLYYSHENQRDITTYGFLFIAPTDLDIYATPKGDYTSEAIFGDLTYPVLDDLRVRGGLRFTHEEKDAFGNATVVFPPPAVSAATGGTAKQDRLTWKAGLDYDVTPSNLLYATASNGFKSGGVNQVSAASGIPPSYGPETIVAEEIGSKNRFLDGRLKVNLDVFHYDYKGFQVFGAFYNPVSGFFFAVVNSQTASFTGGEVEVQAAITRSDQVSISATQLKAKFNQFVIPQQGIDYSGNFVANAPHYTSGATYRHTVDLGDGSTVDLGLNTELVGGEYVDYSNNPGSYQKAYTRSGGGLTYARTDGWSLTAYVRNVENHGILATWQAAAPGENGRDNAMIYPPRTFGLTVKKSFGASK